MGTIGLASVALLYVGPDQLMPLASVLGAVGGAVMIFWRQVKAVFAKLVGAIRRD